MGAFEVFGMYINQPKILLVKIFIIFIPIFLVAHFTQNMIYVLPTLAIGVMFGASINQDSKEEDDGGDDGDDGGGDAGE